MNSRRILNTKIARCRTDKKKITVFGVMLLNGDDVAMISEGSKAGDFVRFLGVVRRENPMMHGRTAKRSSGCWTSRALEKKLKAPSWINWLYISLPIVRSEKNC
jgi:hypothetical protein